MIKKIDILNLNREQIFKIFNSIDEKSYRIQQVMQWIHKFGTKDFLNMTNINKKFRNYLNSTFKVELPSIAGFKKSKDGTCKWLLKLKCKNYIETVFIPEKKRKTLCISSQIGCIANCSFCYTGKMGFSRNLSLSEILGQIWLVNKNLNRKKKVYNDKNITNIVIMGMGEPLFNFKNIINAINIIADKFTYNIPQKKITLSTVGIVPILKKLYYTTSIGIAISLHAPNEELRNILVPINKKYPLFNLIKLCKEIFNKNQKRKVTFEYIMLKNINDQSIHADQLIKLLNNILAKVNLIPFNMFPHSKYESSSMEVIKKFNKKLLNNGIYSSIRKTRGLDINASCGQLYSKIKM
ncbi:23S rRNA (adenine(2503)-C(2))-methyltransferase RlmN [Candidatus Legionella polyplacis]|uniref:23S rRNA (adenine(2503)-C(2))-methyltransferase RlmN n=1 Tax=Candidatus Legionella polyplacis TaxID=2005262 RepID=UPI0011AB673B|nr:23S rRNA (adenine(2503)-C(2))-methyltransferase RlmN [Candidatus Legionella polyplacis]